MGPGGGSGNREGQRWDSGPGCPIRPSPPGLANRNFRNRRIRLTWFRLLLEYWAYNWHRAYPETELNHFERMKLTPTRGNKVATISNWVKGKFLAHRSLLRILVPLAALIAVLVWFFPLWQISFNPSPQVDDEGQRGFYPTTEEMQAGAGDPAGIGNRGTNQWRAGMGVSASSFWLYGPERHPQTHSGGQMGRASSAFRAVVMDGM